jgi:hypothetical protein
MHPKIKVKVEEYLKYCHSRVNQYFLIINEDFKLKSHNINPI